jgi:hypothetical protein
MLNYFNINNIIIQNKGHSDSGGAGDNKLIPTHKM